LKLLESNPILCLGNSDDPGVPGNLGGVQPGAGAHLLLVPRHLLMLLPRNFSHQWSMLPTGFNFPANYENQFEV
jgi:hypothetical protein